MVAPFDTDVLEPHRGAPIPALSGGADLGE
jgi:hypothetical protein